MVLPVGFLNIVFWVTIAVWSRSAYGQDCGRFNVTRIPGVEPSSYLTMYYFSCADGEFFTSVDVWYGNSVDEVRWICSDGDTSHSPEYAHSYYSRVAFDVGITSVETNFISDYYDDSSDSSVFLGDSYIGGYNLAPSTSTSDGVIFQWSGPFGTGGTYTTDTWTSSCLADSYATGATWWIHPGPWFSSLSGSLNGIQLECASVTSTCYPPGISNQGDGDPGSTSTDDDTTTTDDDDATDGDGSIVTIISVAVSATAAVVAVAVGVCVWCFFRSRHRVSEQAPSLPVRITMPGPSAPECQHAYQEPPPTYQSPRFSARTDPPWKSYSCK